MGQSKTSGECASSGPVSDHVANGWPHFSHPAPPSAANEPRHSAQMGSVLACTSRRSHSRQPAGKNTLTSASPAPESHPLTRFSKLDRPATLAEAYSVLADKQRGNVAEGKSLERDQNCSAAPGFTAAPARAFPGS